MTSYHQTDKGVWTRCRAVKRKGAGVSLCPLEAIGVRSEHRNGMEGIAASGGGVLRRWIAEDTYRETKITPNGDGTFEAATGKRKRVFRMDGTLIGLKERVKAAKIASVNEDPTHAPTFQRPEWIAGRVDRAIAKASAGLSVSKQAESDPASVVDSRNRVTLQGEDQPVARYFLYRDGAVKVILALRSIPGHYYDSTLELFIRPGEDLEEAFHRTLEFDGESTTLKNNYCLSGIMFRATHQKIAPLIATVELIKNEVDDYRTTQELLSLAGLNDPQFGGGE